MPLGVSFYILLWIGLGITFTKQFDYYMGLCYNKEKVGGYIV